MQCARFPREDLRDKLVLAGVPFERHSREELWSLLAARWKTTTPTPESITTDALALTTIALLTGNIQV